MNRHLQGHLLLPVRPEQPRLRQDLAAKRLLLASSSCQRSQGTWRSRPSRRKRPGRQHRRPRGSTRTSGISFACWMAVGGPGSHNSRDPGFPRWAGARASVSAAPPRSCSWSCGADAAGSWQRFDTAPLLPESNAAPGLLQKPLFSLSLSLSLFLSHRGGRSGAGVAQVLQVPWAAPPHAKPPAPGLGLFPRAEGKCREGGFIRLSLTSENAQSPSLCEQGEQPPVYTVVSRLVGGCFSSNPWLARPLTRGLWFGECFDLKHSGPWWYLEL